MKHFIIWIIFLFVIHYAAVPDELELANGDLISGRIISMDNEQVVIETDYGRIKINRNFIKKGMFATDPGELDSSGKIDTTSDIIINEQTEKIVSSAKIPRKGLVCELLFDGTFADSASTQYALKNVGNVQFSIGIDGLENHSAMSDGSGQYLILTGQKEVDELTSFTISCWIYVDDWEKTQYIVSKWTSTTGEKAQGKFAMYTKQGFVLCYIVDTTKTYHKLFTDKPMKLAEWNHIVAICDKGNTSIYINNTIQAKKSFNISGINKDSSPLYILTAKSLKNETFSYYNCDGKLDNFRIYNRPLSSQEVAILYSEKTE